MAQDEQTSLRCLQLKDGFRRMMVLGVDATDKQSFAEVFKDVPGHYWEPLWQMYRKALVAMVDNATAEFEEVCKEVDLQGQLEELEGLCLQRGRPVDASGPQDPDAAPRAAEVAACVAAKRKDVGELCAAIEQVEAKKQELTKLVLQQQQRAAVQKENIETVKVSVKQVYQGSKQWLANVPG